MDELLVFDTETGGLDPLEHSILSLGAVVWRPGGEVDACEIFIAEQEIKFTQESLQTNRINIEWLRSHGLAPPQAIDELHGFLRKTFPNLAKGNRLTLVGHNVCFDVAFLKRLYRLANEDFKNVFSHRMVDVASVVRFLMLAGKLHLSGASSDEVFEHFGIHVDPKARHTALGDARATARLLDRLIEVFGT